jgi:hypothetical protein
MTGRQPPTAKTREALDKLAPLLELATWPADHCGFKTEQRTYGLKVFYVNYISDERRELATLPSEPEQFTVLTALCERHARAKSSSGSRQARRKRAA